MMITLTVICQNDSNKKIEEVIPQSNDRKWCVENALFSVDGISFFPAYGIENDPFVFAINNSRVSNKLVYRVTDDRVIESSMSDYTFAKFKKGFSDNKRHILAELSEVGRYA